MKKFFSLAAVAAVAATLSACHPPNEQPSDLKVKTATEVAAPTAKVTSSAEAQADADELGMPKYVNCSGNPVDLPSTMSLDCTNGSKVLKDITWSTMTQTAASGSGTLVEDGVSTEDVKVSLSDPLDTSQGLVFNSVVVNGVEVGAN